MVRLFGLFVLQYWLQLAAVVIFGFAAWKYWRLGQWQANLSLVVIAFASLIAVIGAEEWSEWTGNYGWTRAQWRQTPHWWIRGVGFITLVIVTFMLFRRG